MLREEPPKLLSKILAGTAYTNVFFWYKRQCPTIDCNVNSSEQEYNRKEEQE